MKTLKKFSVLLILILGIIAISSCSGDKDEPEMPKQKETTYTITTESNAGQLAQENGLTSKIDYTLIEYNDANEVVNIQDWYNIPDGVSTKKFTANNRATKVVIKNNVYAYKNGKEVTSTTLYYAIVYYLNLDGNLQINLDGHSKVVKYNPI